MTTAKAQCLICNKEKNTFNCGGCSNNFCFKHLTEHRQTLSQQFDEIENIHDELRQTIVEQKNDLKTRLLIKEIDQWEEHSIKKIQQTAEQFRQRLIKVTNKYIIEIEKKLDNLARQLKQTREENEFNEIDINQLNKKLTKLREQLDHPENISIRQETTSFINNIFLVSDTKWKQLGVTIAGGNGRGSELNQLSESGGIFIDHDQNIYIADYGNSRIVAWKCNAKESEIVAGGFGQGDQTNQLNNPFDVIIDKEKNFLIISDAGNRRVMQWSRQNNTNGQIIISNMDCGGLAMDKNGSLYISDLEKNQVRRWKQGEKEGTIVAGGNGEGDQLNQLNRPSFIFVNEDDSLYASDTGNHRVIKWEKDAKEGIVVAGGNGRGNRLAQLSFPLGVNVDQMGQIYVADSTNHRVMRWCKGATEGTVVVGRNGEGEQADQFSGLLFDREGNLYVADYDNARIQKFEIDFD